MKIKNLIFSKKAIAKNVIVLALLALIGLMFLVVAQIYPEGHKQQELLKGGIV